MSHKPEVHVGTIVSGEKLVIGEADDMNPSLMHPYPALDKALQSGYRLHAFRSGGGLRVAFLADAGLGPCSSCGKGYGEHPNIEQALHLAEVDCAAGGQDYAKVYGVSTPHYLTGTTQSSSTLDRWILAGRSFDVMVENGVYMFISTYLHEERTPQEISDGVIAAYKECVRLDKLIDEHMLKCETTESTEAETLEISRICELYEKTAAKTKVQYEMVVNGKTFIIEVTPFVFPGNGDIGCSAKPLNREDGDPYPFMYDKIKRIEGGATLKEHLELVNRELEAMFS